MGIANVIDDDPRYPEDVPYGTRPFTAVNGPVSPEKQGRTKGDQPPEKETVEIAKPQSQGPNHHETSETSGSHGENKKVNGQAGRSSNAATPASGSPTAAVNPGPSGSGNAPYTPQSNGHAQRNGTSSSPKRKRSLSQERGNTAGQTYPGNAPPPSPGGQRASVDRGVTRDREPYGRPIYSPRESYPPPPGEPYQHPPNEAFSHPSHEPYPPPQHTYPPPPQDHGGAPELYPRAGPHPTTRSDYDQPVDPAIAPAPRPYYSDAHLAETLQRENRNYDNATANRGAYGSPEEEDDQPGQYGEYGGSRDSQASLEMDRRKRKRVFSNRTKTGCMTCRRRKKKCDEQHPECNNCLRGGFMCEGYSARNTWQKPANTKQPIPLQSKNGYPSQSPSRAPYPPQVSRFEAPQEYAGPPPQQRPSFDAGRPGPMAIDEDREQVYGRPDAKPQTTWKQPTRPYPSNPPQVSKYQPDEHRESMYGMPPEHPEPHPMQAHPSSSRNGSTSYAPILNTSPPSHNVQAAAQAALTVRPMSSQRREDISERERMLKGLYYLPNSAALTADRENCIQALWRFNNAFNPSHGISPEERLRLFKAILSLRPSPEPPLPNGQPGPTMTELPFGTVGDNVTVEAPFHCDYGYNITIGDDVLIGADCRISDTCAVSIGSRCIFSPNVKLICATYPIDPKRRSGSRGPALGRNIVIEEDCWIGANVTILAGVRVGKSSTVGAGSLLHQDVPRFTVVAGNPAKVSRGIYDDS